MLIKRKVHKHKRKPVTATLKTTSHPDGRKSQNGHEERLPMFIKRTLQMRREGLYFHEIAEAIANEFKLESIPCIATVYNWNKQGMGLINEDILALQYQIRIDQFTDLEKMKAKWMPIATANALEIRRWQMHEGELQPVMDENAVAEQIDATKAIVAIMARQAKLMGLDMEKAVAATGEGPESLQALQIWLVNQINTAPNGSSAIDVQGEVLELTAGIPDVADSV